MDVTRPIPGNNLSPLTPASTYFTLDWNSLQQVNGEPNARIIVLGTNSSGATPSNSPIYIDGMRIYIAKSTIPTSWTTDSKGILGSFTQNDMQTLSANELTIDWVELSYNNQQQIFANTTQVDGLLIPTVLSLTFKTINGQIRQPKYGPVGIPKDMKNILSEFAQAATGTIFTSCLVPTGQPARLSSITVLSPEPPTLDDYYNTYIEDAWNKLNTNNGGNAVTYNTPSNSNYSQCTIFTDSTQMHVSTNGAAGIPPVNYTIQYSDVHGQTSDLFGNKGVWTDPMGFNPTGATGSVILNSKDFIGCAFCRGIVEYQDNFTGGSSGINFINKNSVWNDWKDGGANFYQNNPNFIYAKFLHDVSINATTTAGTRRYCYAMNYDDSFGYDTTATTNNLPGLNPPVLATQAECLQIEIYQNSNMT